MSDKYAKLEAKLEKQREHLEGLRKLSYEISSIILYLDEKSIDNLKLTILSNKQTVHLKNINIEELEDIVDCHKSEKNCNEYDEMSSLVRNYLENQDIYEFANTFDLELEDYDSDTADEEIQLHEAEESRLCMLVYDFINSKFVETEIEDNDYTVDVAIEISNKEDDMYDHANATDVNFMNDNYSKDTWNSGIAEIITQQGHSKEAFFQKLTQESYIKKPFGNIFMDTLYDEVMYTAYACSIFTCCLKMDAEMAIDIYNSKNDNTLKELILNKDTTCGFINRHQGSVGPMNVQLESDLVLKSEIIELHLDKSYGYKINDIIGDIYEDVNYTIIKNNA